MATEVDATSTEPLAVTLTGPDRALLTAAQITVAVWPRGSVVRAFHPVLDYDPSTGQVRFMVGPASTVGALPRGFADAALKLDTPPAAPVVPIPDGIVVR